jgi:hypothetical protein
MNRHESRDAGQAIRTKESLADCLSRGYALKREGRVEEAFQAFNWAVELDVDSARRGSRLRKFCRSESPP